MSGIAALAAAAAATQKIPGTAGVTTTPVSGIKVVTPTIVTPGGVKVTVPGTRQGQGVFPRWHLPLFFSFDFNATLLLTYFTEGEDRNEEVERICEQVVFCTFQ